MDQESIDAINARPCDGDLTDPEALKESLLFYMIHGVGRDPSEATTRDWYYALAYCVRGELSERYIRAKRVQRETKAKRVYYLSMEFLIGRSLMNHLLNLGLRQVAAEVLGEFGQDLKTVQEVEVDAALGNGGLGRLAACFLDSMATQSYPGYGYGLRYDYGMFHQKIDHGQQKETPDHWLRHGNPWEFERPNVIYRVRFGGRLNTYRDGDGREVTEWVDSDDVLALAYNMPVSGFGNDRAGNLRLWTARATAEFDLMSFNVGDYIGAVGRKAQSESLTKVLYPADTTREGQMLRLRQEYFFVSASMQDIVVRHLRENDSLDNLPERVAIQLNDTHPALAVPELLRLLIDQHHYSFERALEITRGTFAYTNHTLMSEALEMWSIDLIGSILPRHLNLIYQLNEVFLADVRRKAPNDPGILGRMSLVDDGRRTIRMAHVAIVGSQKVNGVAEIHTGLLKSHLFPDFHRLYPEMIVNKTNGITPRRWLLEANPPLADLITEAIGDAWITDLDRLNDLAPHAEDAAFRARFRDVKQIAKQRLVDLVKSTNDMDIRLDSMFDTQVKRMHEYKRQLLNVLQVITRYNRMRDNPGGDFLPRTVIFSGKAAAGYHMAKQVIRLINDVAEVVNNDSAIGDRLKVVFVPNYNVTVAETVIPGSDLSEQISTAGMEASGTGNMKFALNGALTIGTLDGANIEIREEVGEDNIFIFGLTAQEVQDRRSHGYDPWQFYNDNGELRRTLDMIGHGHFSQGDSNRYRDVVDALLWGNDTYMHMADYAAYVGAQEEVDRVYRDAEEWTRRAILNVARMGKFSSDRTIHAYAREIWNIKQMTE